MRREDKILQAMIKLDEPKYVARKLNEAFEFNMNSKDGKMYAVNNLINEVNKIDRKTKLLPDFVYAPFTKRFESMGRLDLTFLVSGPFPLSEKGFNIEYLNKLKRMYKTLNYKQGVCFNMYSVNGKTEYLNLDYFDFIPEGELLYNRSSAEFYWGIDMYEASIMILDTIERNIRGRA